MTSEPTENPVRQSILHIVKTEKPSSTRQLIQLVQKEHSLPQQEILQHILDLKNEGKIRLKSQVYSTPEKFTAYLKHPSAIWYWITALLAVSTVVLVFTLPPDAYPLVYLRYLLGSIFILWLPGYTFIKALFPGKELDDIERFALSIGMSLALVPITGLLLNYTPWGIRVTPVTLSLLTLTLILATVALIREYHHKTTPLNPAPS